MSDTNIIEFPPQKGPADGPEDGLDAIQRAIMAEMRGFDTPDGTGGLFKQHLHLAALLVLHARRLRLEYGEKTQT